MAMIFVCHIIELSPFTATAFRLRAKDPSGIQNKVEIVRIKKH